MLSVRNGASAIEFYQTAFGAKELFRIDSETEALGAWQHAKAEPSADCGRHVTCSRH